MMGKLQDGGKADVKREVVSASANLEVISQESFVKRLEGMSSACHNCHRERTRSQRNKPGRKGKAGRRNQHAKANAPIVIHLKDTLRSVGKQRQSSLDGDSDVSSARSTDEDLYTSSSGSSSSGQSMAYRAAAGAAGTKGSVLDYQFSSVYGDVASIPEFVPQYRSHHFHQVWPHTLYHHATVIPSSVFPHPTTNMKSPYHSFLSTAEKAKEKSRKNLTALISVIEKAHMKEVKNIEPNLSRNSTDAKLSGVLNNLSLSSQKDIEVKRRNMAECDNVELICNDLSNTGDKLAESTDDSDTSDKASVVSSADTLSDDATDAAVFDEVKAHEFTSDELEQLAEYTMGAPLIRYDYPPSQCHECVSALYCYQYFPYDNYNMYTGPKHGGHVHSARQYRHPHVQQQRASSRIGQQEKIAASPRTSTSSESDVSSDVEDCSTTSSSSSLSSSSSSVRKTTASALTSSGNRAPTKATHQPKPTRNPRPNAHTRNHLSQDATNKKPVKRATASWKAARQLWDIDFSKSSRRRINNNHGGIPRDSVYVDLTGMDVSISVMYHTEPSDAIPTWPYPVHSLYQAYYTPTPFPASNLGMGGAPWKFTNQTVYPLNIDTISTHELKKYEMSLPPSRPWLNTGSPDKDVPAAVFTVMCYNVLCDKLCTKAMYAYCPTWALSWDYRKKGIMNDILRGNADIITLQEVETEQYYSMFLPELAQLGYDGIFLPKSRVRTMNSDKEKKTVDGCAIFFKKSKFEKVSEHHVEFSRLATKEGASNTDTDMINRVSTKDNIAVVAVLKTRPGAYDNSPVPPPKCLTQMLMVSTAHIHWDPQSPDVKLVQTMMLIEELQKYVKEASMQFRPNAPPPSLDADLCNSIPLILCGDFNSLPDSGVYEFLSKSRLDTNHKDFEGQNYQVFMKDRHENGTITHNFNLTSAYKDVIPFTNYTFDFKGVIDYIFYSDQHLRLHGVMGLQDEEWFRVNKIIGCPHPFVPSDHFPLFAEFSLPVSTSLRSR